MKNLVASGQIPNNGTIAKLRLNGRASFVIPLDYNEIQSQSLGGGKVVVEWKADGAVIEGELWYPYIDHQNNAAEITAINRMLSVESDGPIHLRLRLTGATSPYLIAVLMTGRAERIGD